MTPTRPTLLAVLGVLSVVLGWAVTEIVYSAFGRTLPVPWTAAATLAILAMALFFWAIMLRPRIAGKKGTKAVSPFVAARTAALAMAASRTGAIVSGFYIGVAVEMTSRFENVYVRGQLWSAVAAVIAGLFMVLASLWLEHICRLPGGPDEDKPKPAEQEREDWVVPNHMES